MPGTSPGAGSGRFSSSFTEAFDTVVPALPKRRGRRPRVPLFKVLPAQVFHVMSAEGTLAEHFTRQFADDTLADSSLSERRTRRPWEVFAELMRFFRPRKTVPAC